MQEQQKTAGNAGATENSPSLAVLAQTKWRRPRMFACGEPPEGLSSDRGSRKIMLWVMGLELRASTSQDLRDLNA